MGLTHGIH